MPTRRAYAYTQQYLLRSNLSSLLVLTLLFLYTSWLYRGLKRQADLERHLPNQLHSSSHGFTTTSGSHNSNAQQASVAVSAVSAFDATAATGRLTGSQLTHEVQAGSLFSWGLDDSYRLGRVAGDNTAPQLTLPHLQVLSAAASRHSLFVAADGLLYSMGPNDSAGGGGHGSKPLPGSGQLGRPGSTAPAAVLLPPPAPDAAGAGAHADAAVDTAAAAAAASQQLAGKEVVQVASGRYHSVAVTADGNVLTWGLNDCGQLGRQVPVGTVDSGASNSTRMQTRLLLQQVQQRVPGSSDAAAGAGAAAGAAATTGGNTSSCSHGWSCHSSAPSRVDALTGVKVVAAAAGRYSTLVLDDTGQLWVWGYDGCAGGQLPQQANAWRPRTVAGQLAGKKVVAFDVGYTFWLAATVDGELFTCDNMDDGYAGTLPQRRRANHAGQLGRSGAPHQPGRVDSLAASRIVAVAAGREHALAATSEGQVYSFGGTRAVLGRQGEPDRPALVLGALAGQAVRHVAAGEYFSLAATDSQIFAWGSNAYLCLGIGNSSILELLQPTAVAGPLSSGAWRIHGIAAGYQHAFAIADKPGDAELLKLRQQSREAATEAGGSGSGAAGAVMASGHGSSALGVAGVKVILTEKQQLERQHQTQQQQQQQQQGSVSTVNQATGALISSGSPTAAGTAQAQAAHGLMLQVQTGLPETTSAAAGMTGSNSVSSSDAACGSQGPLPPDWHTSYLPTQGPNLPLPREVWAAWSPSPWHDQLAALSPDVFALLPKELNAMHKNPCWGGLGPGLACLPYFNIIGVSKCGTTDLYHRLTLHKHILAATNKGPHFWDECPYPPQPAGCTAGPSGDFQSYINLFSQAADLIRSRPHAITGEASSNTFTSANGVYLRGFRGNKPWAAWAGPAGANASMPALLREAQPYLRLIVLLRNPVDRYYSAYHYYRWWENDQQQPSPDEFHAHTLRELQQWRDCVASADLTQCVRRYQPQQLVKGMYAQFLQDWLGHFPRHQVLLLRYEDYKAALPQHLEAVLHFLDVLQPDAAAWQAMTGAAAQNAKAYPPMRPDTRQLLREFYAPLNRQLAQALGSDCRWLWLDTAGEAAAAAAAAAAPDT